MSKASSKSPCVGVCKFEAGSCLGCFRTRFEVKAWKGMSGDQRIAVNQRVRPLMAAASGKATRRRRKLEKKRRKLLSALLTVERRLGALAPARTAG